MVVQELPVMWAKWAAKADGPAALAAAEAMAESMARIARALVSHPGRGAPGAPPGLQSGNLRAQIRALPPVGGDGEAMAICGSFSIYSGVQEFGSLQWPNGRFLHWVDARGSMYLPSVVVRPHPYMRLARQRGIMSGAFTKVARAAFWAVVG